MQADFEAEVLATNLRVIASLHRALDLLAGLPVVVFIDTPGAFPGIGSPLATLGKRMPIGTTGTPRSSDSRAAPWRPRSIRSGSGLT